MIWKRVILSWMTLLALVFAPAGAAARSDVSPKTHVGAIDLAAAICIEASGLASAEERLGNRSLSTTDTSDVPHAARGAAPSTLRRMARSLGSAGDDLLFKKAVNTKLPHAIDGGVSRKIFANASEARSALTGLTDSINRAGTFPAGTLVDTARAGRFLVPVGNNGLAVYHLNSRGTAALKTVLNAR